MSCTLHQLTAIGTDTHTQNNVWDFPTSCLAQKGQKQPARRQNNPYPAMNFRSEAKSSAAGSKLNKGPWPRGVGTRRTLSLRTEQAPPHGAAAAGHGQDDAPKTTVTKMKDVVSFQSGGFEPEPTNPVGDVPKALRRDHQEAAAAQEHDATPPRGPAADGNSGTVEELKTVANMKRYHDWKRYHYSLAGPSAVLLEAFAKARCVPVFGTCSTAANQGTFDEVAGIFQGLGFPFRLSGIKECFNKEQGRYIFAFFHPHPASEANQDFDNAVKDIDVSLLPDGVKIKGRWVRRLTKKLAAADATPQ